MLFVSSAELPDPPGTKRRAKSQRKRLSRDAIVETAFVVLDEYGYDGFNMRGVADALGTGPASLYAHVTGKEELLDLMIDRLAAAIEVPEPDPDRWQEQVKAVITDIYRAFLEHPGLARANLGKIPSGPGALHTIDRFMGLLRAGQLPKKVVAYAVDILPLFATAYAFEQGIFAERMSRGRGDPLPGGARRVLARAARRPLPQHPRGRRRAHRSRGGSRGALRVRARDARHGDRRSARSATILRSTPGSSLSRRSWSGSPSRRSPPPLARDAHQHVGRAALARDAGGDLGDVVALLQQQVGAEHRRRAGAAPRAARARRRSARVRGCRT